MPQFSTLRTTRIPHSHPRRRNAYRTTLIYSGPISVDIDTKRYFEAVVYYPEATDSDFTQFIADNTAASAAMATALSKVTPATSPHSVSYVFGKRGNRGAFLRCACGKRRDRVF